MTQNPAWLATTASRSDTSKKPITTKNMTPTNEICSVLVVVCIIALTAAMLMESWQRKQDRKQWKKYEDNRRNNG